jgi:hypothetical protein
MNKQHAPDAAVKEPSGGKKTYRKPAIQVYGTLAQVTNASPGPNTKMIDSPTFPSNTHRT